MTTPNPTPNPIRIISFGYLHSPAPDAERVEDVRDRFRDPARVTGLLDLTGHDPRVRDAVLTTPGVRDLLDDLAADIAGWPADRPRRVAVGCAGGRHRSVAIAEELAAVLSADGWPVMVEHLHVHLPRVLKPAEAVAR
ncbi:UPF0042 nucleotide-binding protein [Saccharothrix coeruleofusca]|uniref:RapZ C-terminal domain-containing protein n=1 Tax=Saccharothrix coeruleofusca TaxID=33919 RepID=UPI001AE321A0|nr:RNase adapter RapZ [Saccharothrix coeruleofusca]MBP2341082.1 UPF0042 nucleotide-binding protein [Saccharothrix coeruleofusca]